MNDDSNRPASGILCRRHFETRTATADEVQNCADCQAARRARAERVQRDYTIDPEQPYGAHISLTCRNHPNLKWSTKNIDYIGARSVFYTSRDVVECICPASDLILVKGNDNVG